MLRDVYKCRYTMIVRERDKIRQIRLWLKARIESSVPFQDDTSSRKRHQTLGCAAFQSINPRFTLARCDCALALLFGHTLQLHDLVYKLS
jgi:hypothetical protein